MSYRIQPTESISDNIRRIVSEQLSKAVDQLVHRADNWDEAVHDTRKRLKKSRAALRLVRDSLGHAVYKRENACFRDAGRQLSDLRDAQVRIQTLDQLKVDFTESISETAFVRVRSQLSATYRSLYQCMFEKDAINPVIQALQAAQERVETSWSVKSEGWSALKPGLKRVYKRGYQALQTVQKNPTPEHLHNWRKRVKYLWYHFRILQPIWPAMMTTWAKQTHTLADYLGDDHDLAVLGDFITQHPDQFADCTELDALFALMVQRRMQLQAMALPLGQKLYLEKPKVFKHRMGGYWQICQSALPASSLDLIHSEYAPMH